MTKKIKFGDKLHERVKSMLHDEGFELVHRQEAPFEVLVYERSFEADSKSDQITFHGYEYDRNFLYADATSRQGIILRRLKELLSEYPSLSISEDDKWEYRNEQELDAQLEEIAQIIETKLVEWFTNPSPNPTGMDMSPKVVLSEQELEAKLQEKLRIFRLERERAYAEGRVEDIERLDRSLSMIERKLSE